MEQMAMLVNGEPRDSIDANNRGLAYGDGVFETILLHHGKPVFLERHLQRLRLGCHRLGIGDCRHELELDLRRLEPGFAQAGVLKIIVTRGAGGRGYRTDGSRPADRILSLHPAPPAAAEGAGEGIEAFVCRQRLARQPALAGIKHLNRLEQVLASREWPADPGVREGVMLDTSGFLVEGTRSNLFWSAGGKLFTPVLDACGVKGILREILIDFFGPAAVSLGQHPLEDLLEAEEVFVCNSVFGIWPVLALRDGETRREFAAGDYARRAREHYRRLLASYED